MIIITIVCESSEKSITELPDFQNLFAQSAKETLEFLNGSMVEFGQEEMYTSSN